MKHFRKFTAVERENNFELVPFEQFNQAGGQMVNTSEQPMEVTKKGNAIRQYALDRQRKLLLVVLQLAKKNLYSENLSLRMKDGTELSSIQFINLLNYAMSQGKALAGIQDFVEMLFEARITPEMLVNENVKLLLRDVYRKRGMKEQGIGTDPRQTTDSYAQYDNRPTYDSYTQSEPMQTIFDAYPEPIQPTFNFSEPIQEYRDSYLRGSTPPPPQIELMAPRPMDQNVSMVSDQTQRRLKRGIDEIRATELRPSEPRHILRSKRQYVQEGSGWEDYDSDKD